MDSLEALFPRDASVCTGGKQWYVCTIGGFRGCCSSDPCTTGVCPDDDDATGTMTTFSDLKLTTAIAINRLPDVTPRTITTSSMTTLTEAVTMSEDPTTAATSASLSKTPVATSEPSATSETSTLETISPTTFSVVRATSSGAASPTTTASLPNTSSSNRGAIIGGVLGGLAAIALIAILIFCCIRRRRKEIKHGKRSRLWHPRRAPKDPAESKAPSSPSSEATRSLTAASTTPSTETNPLHLTPTLVLTPSPTTLIPFSPQKNQPPPLLTELQDTGRPRLCAELPSSPQSERINIPRTQRAWNAALRTGPRAWELPNLTPITASPRESPVREGGRGHAGQSGSGSGSGVGVRRVPDGVVLGANLDRYSNGLEIGLDRGVEAEGDHVMSFMQFDRSGGGGRISSDLGGIESGSGAERVLDEIDEDVPPAYEAGEGSLQPEIKSPSGRMG
ncbi:unnamed protein product [Penicillium olsonii]|uniref:Uncharacterized protein n=1 Tax=Penicillium olsonii TaxID=99116 RepID=A0A9W4HR79_PENOL|nr:unnamed protein product [Penicillium olsonii]CAG8100621.1 unnamed protein product [Penicillium olsonii]